MLKKGHGAGQGLFGRGWGEAAQKGLRPGFGLLFFNHVGIMRGSREKCVVFLSDVGVDAGGLFWSWWSGSRAHKGMTSTMTGIVVSQKGV